MTDATFIHAGEHLEEFLDEYGISQSQFAKIIGRKPVPHQPHHQQAEPHHGRNGAANRSSLQNERRDVDEPPANVRLGRCACRN